MLRSKSNFRLLCGIILFAVIGFADASYLAAEHYLGEVPPCSVLKGCEQVTTSAYSTMFGVSVALPGALYYLAVIIFSIYILDSRRFKLVRLLSYITWGGLIAAIYFTLLQVVIIKAYCIYCLTSAMLSTIIFILSQYTWAKHREYVNIIA